MKRIKLLTCMIVSSLLLISTMWSPLAVNNEYKSQVEILSSLLETSAEVSDLLKYVGLTDKQIKQVFELEARDESFYDRDLIETTILEDLPAGYVTQRNNPIQTRVFDGNIPKDAYKQADRIAYIYSVAINKFSRLSPERFNRYIYYLYMSHYIDNERYTPNSPNFEYCISYILCEEDLAVYDNFARTQFGQGILDASTSAVSGILGVAGLADDLADSSENLTKLQKIVRKLANVRDGLNTDADLQEAIEKTYSLFIANYDKMNSAQELINVINANLSDYDKPLQDLGNMLVDVLIASILNTNPIVSLTISGLVTALDTYESFINLALLAGLGYSFSERVAARFYIQIGMGNPPE